MSLPQRLLGVAAFAFALIAAGTAPVSAATITIVNLDGPSEGLNDATPTFPVGGNNAATLGGLRLAALEHAAALWGAVLESDVEIRVGAKFDPQFCSGGSAILGSAGPESVHMDFTGAPIPGVWYPQALANKYAGVDLAPGTPDIGITFNRALDEACSAFIHWYYGIDGNPDNERIDFVTVALHELAHGLGFAPFASVATGALFMGHPDAYSLRLENHRTAASYTLVTDQERQLANHATANLHWIGPAMVAAGADKTAGIDANGHVQMFAPPAIQLGSSVAHLDSALFPDELMEPSYTGPNHDVGLALPLMNDLGWVGSFESCGDGDLDAGESCDDGNRAIGDCCSPLCEVDAIAVPCVGEDACTVRNRCSAEQECGGGSLLTCDDGKQCTSDSCNSAIGCEFAPNGDVCRAPLPLNDEFAVNSYTTGIQHRPDLCSAPDGRFVVVWYSRDQDGDSNGVFGQRFDLDGAVAGTEFRVNSETNGAQDDPHVCCNDDASFVVVWNDEYQGVLGQRFSADADAVGTEFTVTGPSPTKARAPDVGCNDDGSFVVVWTEAYEPAGPPGRNHTVFGQQFDSSAVPASAAFRVNSYLTMSSADPSVATLPDGFVVIWHGTDFENRGDVWGSQSVYGRQFGHDGVANGSQFRVNTFTTALQDFAHVAADGAGNFVVVWHSSDYNPYRLPQDGECGGIYAQRYDADGSPAGSEIQVNTYTTGCQSHPTVAATIAGEFVVVWNDYVPGLPSPDGDGQGTAAQSFNALGTRQGGQFQPNQTTADDQVRTVVAADERGVFSVVWVSSEQDGDSSGIFGRQIDGLAPVSECGDPTADGTLTAADALYVLRTSIGLAGCAACVCDANGSGDVTAGDALTVLQGALGTGDPLSCSICE